MHVDLEYGHLVRRVLDEGFIYEDDSRDYIKMLQIPNHLMEISMSKGFPLITTKRISWKTVLHELIWMLSGSTRIDYLQENGVKIWDKDAKNFDFAGKEVGRIYGAQWRTWTKLTQFRDRISLDQINEFIRGIVNNRFGRRHIVTAWNPAELNQMALPPCHWSFEFMPNGKSGFDLKWHQRSCDLFLGIPFDIALYAFIGKIIEHITGLTFIKLYGDLSNVHFYWPHIELVKKQVIRTPTLCEPTLVFNRKVTFDNITHEALHIENYESHPAIKAQMYAKVK